MEIVYIPARVFVTDAEVRSGVYEGTPWRTQDAELWSAELNGKAFGVSLGDGPEYKANTWYEVAGESFKVTDRDRLVIGKRVFLNVVQKGDFAAKSYADKRKAKAEERMRLAKQMQGVSA